MKRYFKATDGIVTVFRASATRAYLFASFNAPNGVMGGKWEDKPSFSAKAGKFPAEEISKVEYDALVARKNERIGANKPKWAYSQPWNSWIRN